MIVKDRTVDIITGAAALRGLSVPELATKARIPQRSMYRKLASPSLFRLDEIRKIAKVSAMTDEQIIEIVRG